METLDKYLKEAKKKQYKMPERGTMDFDFLVSGIRASLQDNGMRLVSAIHDKKKAKVKRYIFNSAFLWVRFISVNDINPQGEELKNIKI